MENKELIQKIAQDIISKKPKNTSKMYQFLDEKIENFCNFLQEKNIEELNHNIDSLKLIYQLGGLSLFIKTHLLPLKEEILTRNILAQKKVLSFICEEEKVEEIVMKFTEEEKEKIYTFMNLLLDCTDKI